MSLCIDQLQEWNLLKRWFQTRRLPSSAWLKLWLSPPPQWLIVLIVTKYRTKWAQRNISTLQKTLSASRFCTEVLWLYDESYQKCNKKTIASNSFAFVVGIEHLGTNRKNKYSKTSQIRSTCTPVTSNDTALLSLCLLTSTFHLKERVSSIKHITHKRHNLVS